jgi:putative Mg2+ transporter-C (MgtC) family protein
MQHHELTALDFVTRLAIGALLGVAIGFERQWRHRAAGLHTSGLVAIGATLFALLDSAINAGDSTRILAGVVSGVGFIAAGVILRDGANVSGLNTAATIWAVAAVGAMAGIGLPADAAIGAVAIILVNVLLQPLVEWIDARGHQHPFREALYKLSVACDAKEQSSVRSALIAAAGDSGLRLESVRAANDERGRIEIRADLYASKRDHRAIEALSARLAAMPGVFASDWHAVH